MDDGALVRPGGNNPKNRTKNQIGTFVKTGCGTALLPRLGATARAAIASSLCKGISQGYSHA
jgi:hypothetical protein